MTNEEELAKIIYFSREIESILKNKFQVKGKGLHTYIDSIENKIETQLVKDLRYIATIRNKSMHESSFKVDNFSRYKRVAEESIYRLNNSNISKKIPQPVNRKRDNSNINRARFQPVNIKNNNKNNSSSSFRNIVFLTIIILSFYFLDDDTKSSLYTYIYEPNIKEEVSYPEIKKIKTDELTYMEKEIAKLEEEIRIDKLKNPKIIEEKFNIIENFSYQSSSKNTEDISDNKRPNYYSCSGKQHCSQMSSCEEAKFYINNCPNTKMDGDNDGIPCERQLCY